MKKFLLVLIAAAMSLFGASAFAVVAPVDLTAVTAAVDFSTVISGVLLVAAALAGVYIAWKGAKMILTAIRGG